MSGIALVLRNPVTWMQKNLFSSVTDGIITCVITVALIMYVPPLLDWMLFSADFIGSTREACNSGGACWVFVLERFTQFIYGYYPKEELWRVNLGVFVMGVAIFASLTGYLGSRTIWLVLTSVVLPVVVWFLFLGGFWGLEEVATSQWGGLLVTLVVSFVGITFSLPLGMALALARRGSLPVLRVLATVFIEGWRGVPLITVLFMSSVMLPLFLPEGWQIDKLLRALLGVLFFASAYMAEVIRGGLQALPQGQYEASNALGLSYFQKQRLIILPQALQMVIPGIANIFIALLKDTTLVSIIGMFDLLGIVKAANADPYWLGFATEGYVFAALIFWLMCFVMSRYSLRIERQAMKQEHAQR